MSNDSRRGMTLEELQPDYDEGTPPKTLTRTRHIDNILYVAGRAPVKDQTEYDVMFVTVAVEDDEATQQAVTTFGFKVSQPAEYLKGAHSIIKDVALRAGVDIDKCYYTAACKWLLPRAQRARPSKKIMRWGLPVLEDEIRRVKPKIIVCLGKHVFDLIAPEKIKFADAHGCWFWSEEFQAHMYVMYAPYTLVGKPELYETFRVDFKEVARRKELLDQGLEFAEPDFDFEVIRDQQSLEDWLDHIEELAAPYKKEGRGVGKCGAPDSAWPGHRDDEGHPLLAVDCEWHGQTHLDGQLRTMQVAWSEKDAVVIEFLDEETNWSFQLDYEGDSDRYNYAEVGKPIAAAFERMGARYIGHHFAADAPWMSHQLGITVHERCALDTEFAQQTVDESSELGLERGIAMKYTNLGRYDQKLTMWKRENKKLCEGGYGYIPSEILHPYGAADVIVPYRAYPMIVRQLKAQKLWDYYKGLFNPFVTDIFTCFTMTGLPVDRPLMDDLRDLFTFTKEKLDAKLKERIHKEAKAKLKSMVAMELGIPALARKFPTVVEAGSYKAEDFNVTLPAVKDADHGGDPEPEEQCPNCRSGTLGLEGGRLVCRGECGHDFGDMQPRVIPYTEDFPDVMKIEFQGATAGEPNANGDAFDRDALEKAFDDYAAATPGLEHLGGGKMSMGAEIREEPCTVCGEKGCEHLSARFARDMKDILMQMDVGEKLRDLQWKMDMEGMFMRPRQPFGIVFKAGDVIEEGALVAREDISVAQMIEQGKCEMLRSAIKVLLNEAGKMKEVKKWLERIHHLESAPTFNIRSPDQMARWLFDFEGLTPIKSTNQKAAGLPSMAWEKVLELPENRRALYKPAVDKQTLEILSGELDTIDELLNLNAVGNLSKAFLKEPDIYIDENTGEEVREENGLHAWICPDERLHNQYSTTETGRPRAWMPNVLNIPSYVNKRVSVSVAKCIQQAHEEGDLPEHLMKWVGKDADKLPSLRSCVKAPEGYIFVESDYATAEMVALAKISGDKDLSRILEDPDPDWAVLKPGHPTGASVVRVAFSGEDKTGIPDDACNVAFLMNVWEAGEIKGKVTEDELLRDAEGNVVHAKYDIHWSLIERTYGKCREMMKAKVDRAAAKVLNFSSAYGATEHTLERKIESDTGVKPEPGTGERGLEAIAERQPQATLFLEAMARVPKEKGYYRAASGRVRHCLLHAAGSGVGWRTRNSIESALGREMRNFPMQESVAATSARACRWLLNAYRKLGLEARPVTCLYDSVVTLCPLAERFLVARLHDICMSEMNTWDYSDEHGERELQYSIDNEFNWRWSTRPPKDEQATLDDPAFHPETARLKFLSGHANLRMLVS